MPYAFTEQGVAMLASVLNSPKAIDVNIMRAFTPCFITNLSILQKTFAMKLILKNTYKI